MPSFVDAMRAGARARFQAARSELQRAASADGLTWRVMQLLIGYGAAIFAICLLACIVPARRALRVESTEALRADG